MLMWVSGAKPQVSALLLGAKPCREKQTWWESQQGKGSFSQALAIYSSLSV